MKKLVILFSLLLAAPAFAKTHHHWVQVAKTETHSAMLDDSRRIEEDGYVGFNVMTFFVTPFELYDAKIGTVLSVFEINCQTGAGRARRLSYIDLDSNEIEARDTVWKPITGSPAIQTLEAVRQRVCEKAASI